MNYLRDDAAMRNPPPEITTLVVDPSTLNINTTHSTPYEEPSDTIIPLIVPSIFGNKLFCLHLPLHLELL